MDQLLGSRRRSTTPRHAAATPPALRESGPVVVASSKLKMREGCEMDSCEAGSLPANSKVHIIDRCELTDGTKRVRISYAGGSTPLGWVSCCAKNGAENLTRMAPEGSAPSLAGPWTAQAPPLPPAAASTNSSPSQSNFPEASSRVPRIAMLLPPTSATSGGLTARSTAKAAAAAGVAKATLSSQAVAATASAVREAVLMEVEEKKKAAAGPVSRLLPSAFRATAKSGGFTPSTPGRSTPNTPGRAPASVRAKPPTPTGQKPSSPGPSPVSTKLSPRGARLSPRKPSSPRIK